MVKLSKKEKKNYRFKHINDIEFTIGVSWSDFTSLRFSIAENSLYIYIHKDMVHKDNEENSEKL